MPRALRLMPALILIALPATAAQKTLELDPEATQVSFDLQATGENVHGTLYLQSAEISFAPLTGAASGEVRIDARKAETGGKKRDKAMHKKVLESDRFALIRFTPERLVGELAEQGASEVELVGTVELLGREHPLSLPAKVEIAGDTASVETHFVVPYVDWGLRDPSFLFLKVAKSVEVTINGSGALVPPTDVIAQGGL